MIMFAIKLFQSIKKAIAGRKHPHQLAGGVAFGLLLGIVPHGNLLAVAILLVVLTLRINHAMAGLTTIGASYVATRLDPYSHEVGNYVLTNPRWGDTITKAWEMPLMPWTDLNNTVVMGSFVIGLMALLPVFILTYPFFNLFAATAEQEVEEEKTKEKRQTRNVAKHSVVLVDQGSQEVSAPHVPKRPQIAAETVQEQKYETDSESSDQSESDVQPVSTPIIRERIDTPTPSVAKRKSYDADSLLDRKEHVSVETRIDVIRMKDYQDNAIPDAAPPAVKPDASDAPPPTDEALNYLLHQLRDSQQQRKAG